MRWVVLPTAIADYRRLADHHDDDEDDDLRRELIDVAERSHHAQQSRPRADGLEVWRGPAPARVRLLVKREEDAAVVHRVEASHRGGRIRRKRRKVGRGLAELLRLRIEQSGHTVEDVAALAGVDLDQLELLLAPGNVEPGTDTPRRLPSATLKAVCRALGLRLELTRIEGTWGGYEDRS